MKHRSILITIIACLLLTAGGIAWAHDEKPGQHSSETGEPSIITRDYIQEELKLSAEQKQKLQKTSPGFEKILASQDNGEIWATLEQTMNAEQFKRFEQLELQHEGPPALSGPGSRKH